LSDKTSNNALSTSDREKLDDEVFDIPRLCINTAAFICCSACKALSNSMSILLHDYKQLTECISEVERMEAEVKSKKK
jgi:hypothetical protein